MELMIEDLMEEVIERGGSDLHLSAGLPPYIRISGKLTPTEHEPMTPESCQRLIFSMLNNTQRKQLEQTWELDCSYGVKGLARFRVNVYKDRGTYAACLRALSSKIPSMDTLGLPNIVRELSEKPRGLILVTGPTGSGKSTTLASMINNINLTRPEHILTVEDPIEFVYEPIKSLIHQRQIGEDTKSFANALRAALREDPDVILVGEMRDLETTSLAVEAASTGHLVFATVHTTSAVKTVDRVVEIFPDAEQLQIRSTLADGLRAVISQVIFKRVDIKSRCVALEILIATPAVRNLIREQKTYQIPSMIQTGKKYGMQLLDDGIMDLYNRGWISSEDAYMKANDKPRFRTLLKYPPTDFTEA